MHVYKMEIEVIGETIAECKLDLVKFKSILGKDWNLKKAVEETTTITKRDKIIKESDIMDLMYLCNDWGHMIDMFKEFDDTVILFRMFRFKYKDWTKYKPGILADEGRKMVLEEKKEDGEDVMIFQSYVPHPSFAVKNTIDNGQFTYKPKDWKILA